ncbi:MAG: hypothetical protein O6940_07835 [Ignavibacteria bacterium]|nr:hypothetical protein [Ignavibacteria bacterium]
MIDLADINSKIVNAEKRLKSAIRNNFSLHSINLIRDNLNYLKERKEELKKLKHRPEGKA